jgi:hypothetical protein
MKNKWFKLRKKIENGEGGWGYKLQYYFFSKFSRILVGLSSGHVTNSSILGVLKNSYAIRSGFDYCRLSGKEHHFEWPTGAIKPESKGQGDVLGCGLLLNAKNEVSIFFTGNGLLMGQLLGLMLIRHLDF